MPKSIIVKFGGSLLRRNERTLLQRIGEILAQYSVHHPLLVVPGGGSFADLVRQCGTQMKLKEETCHFMALSAMDQFGYLLQEFIPNSKLIDLSKKDLLVELKNTTVPHILLCSQFFGKIPQQEIPRSWDVTSDSLAAYLTKVLDSSLLIILKSKDIDPEIQEPDVDKYFSHFLPFSIPVWFINGTCPDRLARFFQTGSTRGLYLPPNSCSGQLIV